jgi:hypothetical protein
MRTSLAIAAISIASLGCSVAERPEAHYETAAAAREAGAVERGWVPEWLPTEAESIREIHDLDTNEVCLRFSLSPDARTEFVSNLDPMAEAAVSRIPGCRLAPPWWFEGIIQQQPANDNALYAELYHAPPGQWSPQAYIAIDRLSPTVYAWSR